MGDTGFEQQSSIFIANHFATKFLTEIVEFKKVVGVVKQKKCSENNFSFGTSAQSYILQKAPNS